MSWEASLTLRADFVRIELGSIRILRFKTIQIDSFEFYIYKH